VGVLKLPKLRLLWLWGPIILCVDLWLRWGLKKNYSPHQELFNNMSHATCTQGNWVNSWLLMVGNQTTNLTPFLYFGHNLCFRCPNGWCEPILNIYVSINFQWFKELFKPMGFDPCHCSLKIRESFGTLTPQVGVALGVWRFTLSHFLAFLGTWDVTPGFLSAHNLASFCCGHEPKARVVTLLVLWRAMTNLDSQDSPRLGLGEAATFSLIVYYVPFHKTHIQMAFCPGTPKWESQNCQNCLIEKGCGQLLDMLHLELCLNFFHR
jgi:hypothetical protein